MSIRCGEHGTELVYSFPRCGWICPDEERPMVFPTDEMLARHPEMRAWLAPTEPIAEEDDHR